MKSAIFIRDGLLQVVLTPESDIDKMACKELSENKSLEVYQGSFYQCRGGWHREGTDDSSTIFVCRKDDPKDAGGAG